MEVVLVDYDGSNPSRPASGAAKEGGVDSASATAAAAAASAARDQKPAAVGKSGGDSASNDKDDVFSDSEGEESGSSRSRHAHAAANSGLPPPESKPLRQEAEQVPSQSSAKAPAGGEAPRAAGGELGGSGGKAGDLSEPPQSGSTGVSEFKAIAADASVFSFGDEDDYESE